LPIIDRPTMKGPNTAIKKRGRPKKYKKSGSKETTFLKTVTSNDTTGAITKRKYKKRQHRNAENNPLTKSDVKSTRSSAAGLPASNEVMKSQILESKTDPKSAQTTVGPKRGKYQKWIYLNKANAPEPTAPIALPATIEIRKSKSIEKKAYACTECNESFKLQVYLRYHQKNAHANNNIKSRQQKRLPYGCLKCTKRFATDEQLLEHRQKAHKLTRKHSMAVFNCTTCEKSFSTEGSLVWHQKEHKKEENRKHLRYECSKCTIGFFRQARLEHHIERVHHLEMDNYVHKYRCQRCQTGFHVAISYNTHVKDCKGVKANELNDTVEKGK
jgi:uncharacterized Zn-finger protein